MEHSVWFWAGFLILVAVLLLLDLGVFNRRAEHISVGKALKLTAFWIAIALAFGIFVLVEFGTQSSVEYYTAYVVEKAMSVDNIFVFIIVFSYFGIPDEYQHKALFYGIAGAIVFRAVFIFLGVELLSRFDFMMYIFGALLVYAAVKTVTQSGHDEERTCENAVVRGFRRLMPVADGFECGRLFTRKDGVLMATSLFLAILALESTDILFAIDSIPAVLAISQDTFIVYTSNIFAILGLRSLYFALRGIIDSFSYLKYGLGAILAFVGAKMFLSNVYHIPVVASLCVILGVLSVSIAASVVRNRRKAAST